MDTTLLATVGIVAAGGFVRGITGFGGAMLMSPLLSILIGPVPTVVTALVLETTAALVTFPEAIPKARWRTLAYLTIPAIATVPLGGYLLLTIDPMIARRMIAGVVLTFSMMLLLGLRYSGTPRAGTSIALGALVGALLGATSVGAPPVIIYLLSGPDPIAVTRANLMIFVTAISAIGLVMLAFAGAITATLAMSAFALSFVFILATWTGGKLFLHLSDTSVRRLALLLMLSVSSVSLIF
ncbi:MAG: sulfite exporter TauE/SafE family protein [Rhizobiales bacterium]|nr:sulfite exporter TauE/SafE family protein [Hyphomicrobiales bacterium]